MNADPSFLHRVLWIGGPTDSGKTTLARALARHLGTLRYEYDRRDARHHKMLAERDPDYDAFLDESLDQRWVTPTPEQLAQRALQSFADRFPLVLEDVSIVEHSRSPVVIAEGFGITPDLVATVTPHPNQALWLVPTAEFKQASWEARAKPGFASQTSDPERASANLFERDQLLTSEITKQAARTGGLVMEVGLTTTPEMLLEAALRHFSVYLAEIGAVPSAPTPR